MVNKHVLPLKCALPLMGELVFFSRGFKYNLELILFRAYGAPFENNWHLRQDFKTTGRRAELAQFLSRRILWFAVGNLVLSPLIFLWQIMYSIFHYTEVRSEDD
jgi:autophagy-related protein 9